MVCSFHSSVNRCDQATPSPHKPITNSNQSTSTTDTNPSQSSKHEYTEPPTTQPHGKVSTTKAASKDLAISLSIVVPVLVLLIFGCLYVARKMLGISCCSFDTETGIPETVVYYKTKGNLGRIIISFLIYIMYSYYVVREWSKSKGGWATGREKRGVVQQVLSLAKGWVILLFEPLEGVNHESS